MSASCEAVIADFAWFSQLCREPATGQVTEEGETFNACPKHGGGAA